MKTQNQTVLVGLAKCAGLTIEFPENAPIRVSGFPNEDSCTLIDAGQAESELLFAVLQKIGIVAAGNREIPLPWFINRPYENQFAGEVTYVTRRTLRRILSPEKRADLWALCTYCECGWLCEFHDFLKRHPERLKMMPYVWCGLVKNPDPRKILICLNISWSVVSVLFARKS